MTSSFSTSQGSPGWRQVAAALSAEHAATTDDERAKARDDADRAREDALRESADKARENRLRRMAERQGLQLQKPRRRDPRASDYGLYMLVDAATNAMAYGAETGRASASLDEVEDYLTEPVGRLVREVAASEDRRRAEEAAILDSPHVEGREGHRVG